MVTPSPAGRIAESIVRRFEGLSGTRDRALGEGRQITRNELQRIFVRYPEWSPKGAPIVYENNETRGNLYLTEPLQP